MCSGLITSSTFSFCHKPPEKACMELVVLCWHLQSSNTPRPNTTWRGMGNCSPKQRRTVCRATWLTIWEFRRKCEGLSVAFLDMWTATGGPSAICLNNWIITVVCYGFIVPGLPLCQAQWNYNISSRVTWWTENVENHCLQIDHSPLPFLPPLSSSFTCSAVYLCSSRTAPLAAGTTHFDNTNLNGCFVHPKKSFENTELFFFFFDGYGFLACSKVGKVSPRLHWQEIALIQNWAAVMHPFFF